MESVCRKKGETSGEKQKLLQPKVLHTQVHESSKNGPEWNRHYDVGIAVIGIINHEERNGGDDWYGHLVAPSDIKDIIQETEHSGHEQRQ